AQVMTEIDLLVLPTTAMPAPLLAEGPSDSHLATPSLTMPFNVAGTPALAICNGYSASGLPLSLQIVGRPFEDVPCFVPAMLMRKPHRGKTADRPSSARDKS